MKKNIYDLACNSHDTQIALVENQGIYESVDESIVKIYDVGRSRTTDDEPVCIFNFCDAMSCFNLQLNTEHVVYEH